MLPTTAFAADFQIDSLTANYHLDRDSEGVAVLSSEEVFGLRFPSSGKSSSGFRRLIPTRYLKQDVDLKVTGVNDVSGSSIPFNTYKDKDRNLVVNIGDPAITIYGQQTYILRYESRGVVNFFGDREEFLPNFNGRGWQEEFGQIIGNVYLSNELASQLSSEPKCFADNQACQVRQDKKGTKTVITAFTTQKLAAKQSLGLNLAFKKGTFAPAEHGLSWLKAGLAAGVVVLVLALLAGLRSLRQKVHRKYRK